MPRDSSSRRSASPVSVNAEEAKPAAVSRSVTRDQHQPPCQAPCIKTNVVAWASTDMGRILLILRMQRRIQPYQRNHIDWQCRQQRGQMDHFVCAVR